MRTNITMNLELASLVSGKCSFYFLILLLKFIFQSMERVHGCQASYYWELL